MENNNLEEKENKIEKDLEKDIQEAEKLREDIKEKTEKLEVVQQDMKRDVEELEKIEKEEHEKKVIIFVNTRPKESDMGEICFKDVVILAFGVYKDNENVVYTVKYTKGPHPNESGSLTKGKCTKVKKGMEFSVTETDKS